MNIVERVQRICLSPDTEWPVIAAERTPLATLLTGYVLPLAVLSALGAFVAAIMANLSLVAWFAAVLIRVIMSLAMVVVMSIVIDALAPSFGAQKSSDGAGKVAVYSPTPAWVAGLFQFVPLLGGLIGLAGALYTIYLLYLGLQNVMKSPPDKVVLYTLVVVLCGFAVGAMIAVIVAVLGIGTAVFI
jgi:hypothetical protein